MNIEPWQIVAARFCVEKIEFTLKELEDFLKGTHYQVPREHVRNFFIENIQNPAGRQFNRDARKDADGNSSLWTAPADLVSMITDFDELREARKNAARAWQISMIALAVSALAAICQLLSLVIQWAYV